MTFFINKNVTEIPFEKLVSSLTINEINIDPEDDEMKNNIIDYITSLDSVKQYRNGKILLQDVSPDDYESGNETEDDDSDKVSSLATKKAKSSMKDKG